MSERRDDDETRAGIIVDVDARAGAAERRAIAARDADDDDATAVAGATRTPADERREIIVRIEEGSEGGEKEKKKRLELKKLCSCFLLRLCLSQKRRRPNRGIA